jgi:predicted ATPase
MFRSLHIKNFKCWRDTGKLRLAPITVFFGSNSSGKSSLLQFLLMLKQTVASTDRKLTLVTSGQNSLVDLGLYEDFIFNHHATNILEFALELSDEPFYIKESGPSTYEIKTEIIHDKKQGGIKLKKLETHLPKSILSTENTDTDFQTGSYTFTLPNKHEIKFDEEKLFINKEFINPEKFYNINRHSLTEFNALSVDVKYPVFNLLTIPSQFLEAHFEHLFYLAPLRASPARNYLWSGEAPSDVGKTGEYTINALLASKKRSIQLTNKEITPMPQLIADVLKDLGLLDEIVVKPIAKGRREHEILVRTRKSKSLVNLTDVGFGISQLLPVLVELFYVPYHSSVILEQPEIHLHPRIQAGLADIFINALRARELGHSRNLQLIIESHSEHFLRRLQRRVAEEKVDPEQIALYFCQPGPDGSTIEELQLDEYGNISNWPEDFFGDELGDAAAMVDAAMKRQQQGMS